MQTTRRKVIKTIAAAGVLTATLPFTQPFFANAKKQTAVLATSDQTTDYLIPNQTAVVLVDPYNDFLSEDGATWPMVGLTATEVNLVEHLKSIVNAAREAKIPIAYAPHHRHVNEDDFSHRKFLHPSQVSQNSSGVFSANGFGGQWYQGLEPVDGDIVASEHAASSGFAETDLHAHLNKIGVTHLIVTGCISNTCVEATVRSAVDLGYFVTVVTDAIAAFSPGDHLHATNHTFSQIAHSRKSTAQVVADLKNSTDVNLSQAAAAVMAPGRMQAT